MEPHPVYLVYPSVRMTSSDPRVPAEAASVASHERAVAVEVVVDAGWAVGSVINSPSPASGRYDA
jgi:hypothetical protein